MNETKDVTEDILSLGVTEPLNPGDPNDPDSRSIIKLQRFYIQGVEIAPQNIRYLTFESDGINPLNGKNFVIQGQNTTYSGEPTRSDFSGRRLVTFPIKMFDTREGLYNDDLTDQKLAQKYPNSTVPWACLMSVMDIDIANLLKFLMGDFDAIMPQSGTLFSDANRDRNDRIRKGLTAADVPEARGWVLYISDRCGDRDFDGQYDMEDAYPDNALSSMEDVNDNGRLDVSFGTEAPRYTDYDTNFPYCVVINHSYYRRAVRLINGTLLPGRYDRNNPANTKGFTIASENAVYVKGNYNATGVNRSGLSPQEVTPPDRYLPYDTADHIPASIVAGAITILSNSWSDSLSFSYPFDMRQRCPSETTVRFAMLAGDTRSDSHNSTLNQGGYYLCQMLNGGVHNFKRFLED
jgi:hypothetical protein